MYKRGTTHQGGFWRGRKDFFIDFLRRRKMGVQYIPLSFPIKKKMGVHWFFFWKILERNDSLKPSNWSGDCPDIFPVIFCILTYIRIPIILWLFFLWHLCGLIGVDIKGHLSVLLNMIAYKPALFWFHLLVSLILLVHS